MDCTLHTPFTPPTGHALYRIDNIDRTYRIDHIDHMVHIDRIDHIDFVYVVVILSTEGRCRTDSPLKTCARSFILPGSHPAT